MCVCVCVCVHIYIYIYIYLEKNSSKSPVSFSIFSCYTSFSVSLCSSCRHLCLWQESPEETSYKPNGLKSSEKNIFSERERVSQSHSDSVDAFTKNVLSAVYFHLNQGSVV